MLPLWAKVDLRAIAIKGYSAFPKALVFLEYYDQIVRCNIQNTFGGGSYSFADVQSVYSIATAGCKALKEDSNSLVKFCSSNLLTIKPPKTSVKLRSSKDNVIWILYIRTTHFLDRPRMYGFGSVLFQSKLLRLSTYRLR